MKAKDIMREDVVTIHENQTVQELAQLLIEHRISGVPVLGGDGRLVGVVSQTDLVRRDREQPSEHEAPAYHQDLDRWLGKHGYQVETPEYLSVKDIMTPKVLSAEVGASVASLARTMADKRVHRIVITRRKKLAGIVTSTDILRAFIALVEAGGAPR